MRSGQLAAGDSKQQSNWLDENKCAIFPGMQFIRLSAGWRQSRLDTCVSGGAQFGEQIFYRYQLDWAPAVTLDFWYRGCPVQPQTARAFMNVGRDCHLVSPQELDTIGELFISIWPPEAPGTYLIQSAHIIGLKGKMALSIHWYHRKSNREFLSLLIDGTGDGRTIHEVHYSAPPELFQANLGLAHESLLTIQWDAQTPPPLSSIA